MTDSKNGRRMDNGLMNRNVIRMMVDGWKNSGHVEKNARQRKDERHNVGRRAKKEEKNHCITTDKTR